MDYNRITKIPNKIINFRLKISIDSNVDRGITLEENPISEPPIEIIEAGSEALVSYFNEIKKAKTTRLFESKLLIVGQGGVGKTYLMHRLVYDRIDQNIISTEGIEINHWKIKTKNFSPFTVNFWDFGGQEIYHATHQFFLTKRSLYLFVWEARTDADVLSFEYWLNTIKVLSDNSPVIVIQNKIDERKKVINEENWSTRFPNIVDFVNVSAKDKIGVNELKEIIINQIQKLPHVGNVLPKTWTEIRKELTSLNQNYITYAKYKNICSKYELGETKADHLSEYYHDLGVFLSFKNNPILKNTIFLKPEWATNAVYKIADSNLIKEKYGRFYYEDLKKIWFEKDGYPEEIYIYLIELMKSFEICFEISDTKEYILPELLRGNEPILNWEYNNNYWFKFNYKFMPSGILTRFIVITNDIIKDNLFWKDGVVLTWENSEALVKRTNIHEIEIWVSGKGKKTLISFIRRHFDYIHKSFKQLEYEEMIPCVCKECSLANKKYFFPYSNLLNAKRKDKSEIQCQASFDSVSIDKILGNFIDIKEEVKYFPKRKTIKLFLVSSNELNEERTQVELLLSKINRKLFTQNVMIDLVMWEDLKKSFTKARIQNYFNKELLKCEIVLCLFHKKVGEFSKEEFSLAYENLKKGNKPYFLYVYFKDSKIDISEVNEDIMNIKLLKNEIQIYEQIYCQYKNNDDLLNQFKEQLDIIIPEIMEM